MDLVPEITGIQQHESNFSVAGKLEGHPLAVPKRKDYIAEILMRPSSRSMRTDVSRILPAIEHCDPHAAEQLLPLVVYDELHRLAAEKMALEKSGQGLIWPHRSISLALRAKQRNPSARADRQMSNRFSSLRALQNH